MQQVQAPKNVLYHLYGSVPSLWNRPKSLICKEFFMLFLCVFSVSLYITRLPKTGTGKNPRESNRTRLLASRIKGWNTEPT